jgi:hypothetical protein
MHEYNHIFALSNELREDTLDERSVVLEGSSCGLRIIGRLNGAENFVGMGFEEGDEGGKVCGVVPGAVEDEDCWFGG